MAFLRVSDDRANVRITSEVNDDHRLVQTYASARSVSLCYVFSFRSCIDFVSDSPPRPTAAVLVEVGLFH